MQCIKFSDDNGKVFDHLKSFTLKGQAWTWMRQLNMARDGRGAWQALAAHFEADAQCELVKDQSYSSIANAQYHCKKKHFLLEIYVIIHQVAFEVSESHDEHLSKEKSMRELLQAIIDTMTNATKEAILTNPNLWRSFINAVHVLRQDWGERWMW